MKTVNVKKSKRDRIKAAHSLNWLISKNPSLKRLIDTFDLEIDVKPLNPTNHE